MDIQIINYPHSFTVSKFEQIIFIYFPLSALISITSSL